MDTKTNPVGKLVYFDSLFSGLVKCKVISFKHKNDTPWIPNTADILITAKVTDRTNRTYKHGETIEAPSRYMIERDRIYTRSGRYYIKPLPYASKE